MTTPRDPDGQIRAFLLEGDELLNDQVYDVVRTEIERKRQRAFVGPWRTPIMNKVLTYGLGAAAVIAVLFVGAQIVGSPGGLLGNEPTPTATPEATLQPPPPLSQSFTSPLHGYSVSYPEGWTTRSATEPWTSPTFPLNFNFPEVDVLYDPALESGLFLIAASQPIGNATPDEWAAEQMASDGGCGTATEPITVESGTGLIGSEDCTLAVVTSAGRGYWIQLYTGDGAPPTYDKAWFEEVLATVQLHPEDAVN